MGLFIIAAASTMGLLAAVFTVAAVNITSAGASEAERRLEDEDQRRALEEWQRRREKREERS